MKTKKTEGQAPQTTEETAPTQMNWAEKTETRCLRCELILSDRDKYGRESAELVQTIGQIEDEKKSMAARYKAALEEKQARLSRISSYIRDGWEERQIKCEWRFECSGIDSTTGEPIYHPEKKALIRTDTNEVIEVTDITTEERQMALPIEEQPAASEPAEDQPPYEDDED